MSYDRSRIMTRGHEIARGLDNAKDYAERLSTGLSRAWAEAKANVQAHSEPPETDVEPVENETKEAAFYHVMDILGEGLTAITTENATGRLERVLGVSSRYEDGEWVMSAEWRGESVIERREDTLEDALDTAANTVAKVATRSGLLDEAADQIGEMRVRGRLQNLRSDSTTGGQHWVFLDDNTIFHIAFEDSLNSAIDTLPTEAQDCGDLEVKVATGGWMEAPAGPFAPGDTLGDLGIAAEMLTTPELEDEEQYEPDEQQEKVRYA